VRDREFTVRPEQRIVTKMPLNEIWDDRGTITGERIRYLDQSAVREIVGSGAVRFLVGDPGLKLDWIPIEKQFEFWKTAKPQIASHDRPVRREEFPNEFFYVASEWRGRADECVILLERHH